MWSPQPKNKNKPMIGSKASITNSTLEITFLWNKQCNKLIKHLIKHEWNFEFKKQDIDGPFKITIFDICWANNLTRIVKVLEKCEYQQDY